MPTIHQMRFQASDPVLTSIGAHKAGLRFGFKYETIRDACGSLRNLALRKSPCHLGLLKITTYWDYASYGDVIGETTLTSWELTPVYGGTPRLTCRLPSPTK